MYVCLDRMFGNKMFLPCVQFLVFIVNKLCMVTVLLAFAVKALRQISLFTTL